MIKKYAFVFLAFLACLFVTGCAGEEQPQTAWQRPSGITDQVFQRDVAACRSVGESAVPRGYTPFPHQGDPEPEWPQIQQDPMSYRALLKYEKCMESKGYVLEDKGFHPSELLKSE